MIPLAAWCLLLGIAASGTLLLLVLLFKNLG